LAGKRYGRGRIFREGFAPPFPGSRVPLSFLMFRDILPLLSMFLIACGDEQRERARLATGCINASPDNRVKLSGSWSNNIDVEVEGSEIKVRTEVPVGIGLDGRLKFRHREFRCRRSGGGIEYIGADWNR
jgi:hypothetical protein